MPDQEVATLAGDNAAAVGLYRRKYAIPAYQGYKFGRGGEGQEPPARTGRRRLVRPAPAVSEAKPASEAKAPRARRARRSKLDAHRAELGKVADSVIAEKAGVSVQNVRLYRRKHGIALDGDADQRRRGRADGGEEAAEAPDAATSAPEPARRGRKAKAAAEQGGARLGYAVTAQKGGKSLEFFLIAAGLVEATRQAQSAGVGEIVAVRRIGPALG